MMPDTLTAGIGHNNPPEPTPYEAAQKRIDDLYEEAKLWLDGAIVDCQDLADGIANLQRDLTKARKAADEARKVEAKPFDDGKAEVQARYNPLLKKADLAIEACGRANTTWLVKVKAENEAKARAERERADEAARIAREALRASDPTNLAEREAAEQLVIAAKAAERDANRAEKAKPLVGGATGRAFGLRTKFVPHMVDGVMALRHFYSVNPQPFKDLAQRLAEEHCRIGKHAKDELPGFEIEEQNIV
jgi:hypothetical protein